STPAPHAAPAQCPTRTTGQTRQTPTHPPASPHALGSVDRSALRASCATTGSCPGPDCPGTAASSVPRPCSPAPTHWRSTAGTSHYYRPTADGPCPARGGSTGATPATHHPTGTGATGPYRSVMC